MTNIIAEAGSNHNGELEKALELVRIAARSGANSCKFQFINPEFLYLPKYFNADKKYYEDNQVFQRRESEVLSKDEWKKIWQLSKDLDIEVSASVFDEEGADLLSYLGANFVKIASSDLNNIELHDLVSERFSEVVISTGMASIDEIIAIERRMSSLHPEVSLKLMYCTSLYPSTMSQINFHQIKVMQNIFGTERVGFSDHTRDAIASSICGSMGVNLFEKHFTISRDLAGFDHSNALEENELLDYVTILKEIGSIEFNSLNAQSDSETAIRARRGIYAAKDLQAGKIINREDLLIVRPSASLSPMDLPALIGKSLKNDIKQYQALGVVNKEIGVGLSRQEEAIKYWTKEMKDKRMEK